MSARARSEQDKKRRERDILSVARELIFKKGLHETTIKDIAQRAGLSVGAIYLYYKSKEDLYAALQVEALELMFHYLRNTCEGGTSVENKIQAIAQASLQFSRDYESYYDILEYFLSSPGTIFSIDFKSQVDSHGYQIINLIAEVIEEGIKEGVFKRVNPKIHAVIFWSSLFGSRKFRKLQTTILHDVDFDILIETMAEHFVDGLKREKGKD